MDTVALLAAALLLALGYGGFVTVRGRRTIGDLRRELDMLEGHNRMLQDERGALSEKLSSCRTSLDAERKKSQTAEARVQTLESEKASLEQRNRALDAEKADLEGRRVALEATADRLENARRDLETRLTALQQRHSALEGRVVGFQGEWDRQLTTLEEEISTLVRQLGEFRKGTQLPLPGASDGERPRDEPEDGD